MKPHRSGVFPAGNQHAWELLQRAQWEKARAIHRWFSPLLLCARPIQRLMPGIK